MKAKLVNEMHGGHIVLSPELLLKNNRRDIQKLLDELSRAYKVSSEDAAFALQVVLKNNFTEKHGS